jgi:hypothetical protein
MRSCPESLDDCIAGMGGSRSIILGHPGEDPRNGVSPQHVSKGRGSEGRVTNAPEDANFVPSGPII